MIIEKPAEVTVAKTDEIIAAQREAGTLVTVISQHRFDRSTEIAVAAIERGELGRLTSGIASIDWWRGQNYYDSGDWRGTWELDGGGALMNQGVHTVDLLVATLGRPVEVFAYTGTLAHQRIEVEDVTVGVVRFENGALGAARDHGCVSGSERTAAGARRQGVDRHRQRRADLHPCHPARERGRGEGVRVARLLGEPARGLPHRDHGGAAATGSDPAALSGDAHRRQYENFLAALVGEESLRVDLETNRQAIAIITGAYESAAPVAR